MPKFIIANGKLVHALMHTGVTRYMDFRAVEGSYVLKKDKVRKVPATDAEALTSDLLGFFEKRRVHSFFSCASELLDRAIRTTSAAPPGNALPRGSGYSGARSVVCLSAHSRSEGSRPASRSQEAFLEMTSRRHVITALRTCRYVQQYDEAKPATYKNHNLRVMTMDHLYEKFGLSEDTIEFIGHAIALYPDVAYRRRPALATVKRLKLYEESLLRFQGLKSPYIYPLYGLGELPQVRSLLTFSFSLLAASASTRA